MVWNLSCPAVSLEGGTEGRTVGGREVKEGVEGRQEGQKEGGTEGGRKRRREGERKEERTKRNRKGGNWGGGRHWIIPTSKITSQKRESTLSQMNKVVIHISKWKEQYATDVVLATVF